MKSESNIIKTNNSIITEQNENLRVTTNNKEALAGYKNIINKGLEGQFEVDLIRLGKTNTYKVILVKKGGDITKLSKEGQSFYHYLTLAMNDKKITDLNLVYNDENVDVGSFGTDKKNDGKLDIYDMMQFYEHGNNLGATQQGKLTHEMVEQYYKQTSGWSYKRAHDERAIPAENEVNGNTRLSQEGTGEKKYFQTFEGKDGKKRRLNIKRGKNFSVDKILPENQKKQETKIEEHKKPKEIQKNKNDMIKFLKSQKDKQKQLKQEWDFHNSGY